MDHPGRRIAQVRCGLLNLGPAPRAAPGAHSFSSGAARLREWLGDARLAAIFNVGHHSHVKVSSQITALGVAHVTDVTGVTDVTDVTDVMDRRLPHSEWDTHTRMHLEARHGSWLYCSGPHGSHSHGSAHTVAPRTHARRPR